MASIPRLRFSEVAPGCDFHAALVMTLARYADATPHRQDFPEMMYALEGAGIHWLNGQTVPLRAGDLVWVRPDDSHFVSVRPGQSLHFINIAFAADVWQEFRRFAGWPEAPEQTAAHLLPAQRAECERIFQETLRAFYAGQARLDLCRFWSGTLPLLSPAIPPASRPVREQDWPLWLSRACTALQSEDNLKIGAPQLTSLSGVSAAHMSRTLRQHTGQTPTEYVNTLRIERAAALLTTTTQDIIAIASDCGFENISYFYRLFHRRYQQSPRAYRLCARQTILP